MLACFSELWIWIEIYSALIWGNINFCYVTFEGKGLLITYDFQIGRSWNLLLAVPVTELFLF